ncbi:hypothetical protein Palpr_1196 [Paludibacter propionicigenes WB4]|uniref:Uncharacterized protein n=1 Tax=Paludibacter propionicigenes (strain DSM 17365 / JCM 13257 / WB4) TaxID=694427 RepID=E4T3P9_PALPW|nr:hypothetical protein [Paludibacter propionicigenes]ADQ79343.1 hypothetical protein Palpr_1196 [Paludibacter propionicigenes WB4]
MNKLFCILALLFTVTVYGQTNDEVLTNASIYSLCQKGLSPSIIISKIKTSKTNFDVSIATLIKMKDDKIPDEIASAMVDASGNKENVTGDINDPNATHESGLYYLMVNDGKTEMKPVEPTVCSQTKMGSGIMTQLTYGIAKTKFKSTLDGSMARLQIFEAKPVFYFYFEKGQSLNDATSSWFSSSSSPNEFILVKLDVKKKNREFVIGSVNAYSGVSMGVDDKLRIRFDVEKLKSGVYKVTPKDSLEPGEYCFMSAGNSTTSTGTGGKVFDFGIKD